MVGKNREPLRSTPDEAWLNFIETEKGGHFVDDNETKVATLYGRIIVACLAILVALWQIDVDLPVI